MAHIVNEYISEGITQDDTAVSPCASATTRHRAETAQTRRRHNFQREKTNNAEVVSKPAWCSFEPPPPRALLWCRYVSASSR